MSGCYAQRLKELEEKQNRIDELLIKIKEKEEQIEKMKICQNCQISSYDEEAEIQCDKFGEEYFNECISKNFKHWELWII